MADIVPVTEESLRAAMRDPRSWRFGHPEREAYNNWVSEAWQAFGREGEGKNGVVHVRAYTRTRNGKTEHVGEYTRGDPPGGNSKGGSRSQPAQIQLAAAPRAMGAPAIARGAIQMLPAITRLLPRLPVVPRPNLLDGAIDGPRRGSLGPRRWYNVIPEQPGERAAAEEADAEAANVPRPGSASSTPDAAEPERPRYTVNPGQQGKHQPGHNNHIPGRSEIDPDVDVQELVDRFAHRGESVNGRPPGTPDARERFDTGDQVIGTFRDQQGRSAPTTRGIIRYSGKGTVHVVPAAPRGWTQRGGQ